MNWLIIEFLMRLAQNKIVIILELMDENLRDTHDVRRPSRYLSLSYDEDLSF